MPIRGSKEPKQNLSLEKILAVLSPLCLFEIRNGQYMFAVLEFVAFVLGVSYALKYRSAFSYIELYRDHMTLTRGTKRQDVAFDRIGFLEEHRNYMAAVYIGPKEQYLIHSNHYPSMKKEESSRTVNKLAEEIKKRTGTAPFIKYR